MIYKKENLTGNKNERSLLFIRGIFLTVAMGLLYYSVLLLPPSDVCALGHCSIIMIAILSRIFLKEKIGFAHIFAFLLTAVGVVFISKPTIIFSTKSFTVSNNSVNVTQVSDSNVVIPTDSHLTLGIF